MLARNPISLLSIIAWLQTKDPDEHYPFCNTDGKCLFSQYLVSLGYSQEPTSDPVFALWRMMHVHFGYVAQELPWTFGAALERAKVLNERTSGLPSREFMRVAEWEMEKTPGPDLKAKK
jgi:hypothetical protein